jgi:hypothetical protein
VAYSIAGETSNQARSATQSLIEASNTPPPVEIEPPELVGLRAKAADRRAATVDRLAEIQVLPTGGKSHLELLLARHAAVILPESVRTRDDTTTDDVSAVTRHFGTQNAGAFFDFAAGRVEVYASAAVWKPADGSPTIRVQVTDERQIAPADPDPFLSKAELDVLSATGSKSLTIVTGPGSFVHPSGLTTRQINDILGQVQKAALTPLNNNQLLALAEELKDGQSPLVPPAQAYSAVRLVMDHGGDGTVLVWFVNGQRVVSPNGTVMERHGTNLREVTLHPLGVTLLVAETIASILLAIMLLAGGVMMVGRSTRGIALHRLYAVLKVPMTVIGVVAFMWAMGDIEAGAAKLSRSAATREGFVSFWIAVVFAGGIYPLVLLCMLWLPSVRRYEQEAA